jgi:hypothetical protein
LGGGRNHDVNWDAIGAVAELAGAIGVIASLAYLANQIRQNSKSIRAESVRQLLGHSSQLYMSVATSAELVDAQVRGQTGDQLDDRDGNRLRLLAMASLTNYENGFYQYRSGSLPEEIHAAYRQRLSDQLATLPYVKKCWDEFDHRFSSEFRSYVSQLDRDTPAA